MRKTAATIVRMLMAILLLGSMATRVTAQNFHDDMSPSLLPLYRKAYQTRKSTECLPLADSLLRAATAMGDRHGELGALNIKFLHQFYKRNNMRAVDRTSRTLIDRARKYGLWHYYYYAMSNRTSYYVRERRYIEAFLSLDEMEATAQRQNNRQGIYRSMRMKGVVQQYRSELSQAIACFRQAAQYARANLNSHNEAIELNSIADCYRMMGNADSTYATALRAMQAASTQATRTEAARYAAYAAFMLGNDADFGRHYEYVRLNRRSGDNASAVMEKALDAALCLAERRYADALKTIDTLRLLSTVESRRMTVEYYSRQGDYKSAAAAMAQMLMSRYAMDERIAEYDSLSTDNIFRNQRVEAERRRLEIENTRLKTANVQAELRNSSLELGRMRDAAALARADARRDSLAYQRQRLIERQLNDSLAAQKITRLADRRRMRTERAVLLSAIAMAAFGLLMSVLYALHRRRITERLRAANRQLGESNRQLGDALYRAQASERMKAMFLQNMNHDLRRPLDDITQCAQRLVGPHTGRDERRTLAGRIAAASERLTSQVRRILENTDRQSTARTIVAAIAMCAASYAAAQTAGAGRTARQAELQTLAAQMKREFAKPHNLSGLEQAMKPLMQRAVEYGQMDYYYSAVSHKVTYLTNTGQYADALAYQDSIIGYARRHGHHYGIVLGHISLGNIYRKRLKMPQAIAEYQKALDGYRQYGICHDLGIDYKRIAECYLIAGMFDRVGESAAAGIKSTASPASIAGLHGYRAFALYMLGRDAEFAGEYALYHADGQPKPDIQPFVANCLEAMRLMHDGHADEARECMKKRRTGAFGTYVEIAFAERQGRHKDALEATKRMYTSLFGDSKGSYATEWARMSAEIGNNLAALDRQRAAGVNAWLELVAANLLLRRTALELAHSRDAEDLARTDAESHRMEYSNGQMHLRQLSDSLAYQRMQSEASVQAARASRITLGSIAGAVAALALMAMAYLMHNRRMARRLAQANEQLRRTHEQLSRARDEAVASDRAKTRFIQNMSHELRTPLNAIVGFAQILADSDAGDTEDGQMRQIVSDNTKVLNALLGDTLDLADIESGRCAVEHAPVCVNDACREAVEATRYRCAEGVRLVFSPALADGFRIVSDRRRIVRALVEMLANAMKNTASGSITLDCSADSRTHVLTLAVTDTGTGVPEDMHEAIFERFCKVDEFKQGAGLGLCIARAVARSLGGNLDIDSRYTGGARFFMTLPCSAECKDGQPG